MHHDSLDQSINLCPGTSSYYDFQVHRLREITVQLEGILEHGAGSLIERLPWEGCCTSFVQYEYRRHQ